MNWISSILVLLGYYLTGRGSPHGFLLSAFGAVAGALFFYFWEYNLPTFLLNVAFAVIGFNAWRKQRSNEQKKG